MTPTKSLPNSGFVRLKQIIAPYGPLPISRASFWQKVKTREYPQPVKLGPRTTAWRVQDIRALIEQLNKQVED